MKKDTNFDIESIIKKLGEVKKVFCSEADFQFELAWQIREIYSSDIERILLEYPFEITEDGKNRNLDILIIFKNGKLIPIELKYKTTYLSTKTEKDIGYQKYIDPETKWIIFNLKSQKAQNQGCYNYLKDIKRIENFKNKYKNNFEVGYAIMITNDMSYTKEPNLRNNKKCDYYDFSIHNGKNIKKEIELNWQNPKDKYPSIKFDNNYENFIWHTYIENIDKFGTFKYLITKIK